MLVSTGAMELTTGLVLALRETNNEGKSGLESERLVSELYVVSKWLLP